MWCIQNCSPLLMMLSTVPTTSDTLSAARAIRGCNISRGTLGRRAEVAVRGSMTGPEWPDNMAWFWLASTGKGLISLTNLVDKSR